MENKYYTPSIEEFHVGFQGQVEYNHRFCDFEVDFEPIDHTLALLCIKQSYSCVITESIEKNKVIRVKHLDREDIEKLGWEYNYNIIIEDTTDSVSNWTLYVDETENKAKYYQLYFYKSILYILFIEERNSVGSTEKTLFQGTIKNKSELKRLMKQLGITE